MRWFLLAPVDFIVSTLAYPLAPIIALCVSPERWTPPRWCWPWLTPDNPIDGDDGHMERWPGWSWWQTYCRRVAWLWRNRGYGFSYRVCGLDATGPICYRGNPRVSDAPMSPGWCWATCNGGWMLYVYWPWWRSARRGLRIYLGWKLKAKLDRMDIDQRVMLVTHINPVKGWRN